MVSPNGIRPTFSPSMNSISPMMTDTSPAKISHRHVLLENEQLEQHQVDSQWQNGANLFIESHTDVGLDQADNIRVAQLQFGGIVGNDVAVTVMLNRWSNAVKTDLSLF